MCSPHLSSLISHLKSSRGFTLIEIFVVLAVTSILSGMMILYGGGSRRLTSLTIESAKMAQMIERAKSLSVLVEYDLENSTCGYGVRFDVTGRRYALFRYLAYPGEDCGAIAAIGEESYDELESFSMPTGIGFKETADSISDIFFLPPDPRTIMFRNSTRVSGTREIRIAVEDGSAELAVQVNSGGQISF
jgi:prepilin-type N-terminal cleavage/methylation domain-containing protein